MKDRKFDELETLTYIIISIFINRRLIFKFAAIYGLQDRFMKKSVPIQSMKQIITLG